MREHLHADGQQHHRQGVLQITEEVEGTRKALLVKTRNGSAVTAKMAGIFSRKKPKAES